MKKLLLILISCMPITALSAAELGAWYDDLGSPDYGDSTLILESDSGKFFVIRRNGDGSGSRYRVNKSGNSYLKVGDRFGAKYVITEKGLEIHDKAGYIRTAKKIK